MHIYIYIYVYAYIYTHIYVCIHTYIHVYITLPIVDQLYDNVPTLKRRLSLPCVLSHRAIYLYITSVYYQQGQDTLGKISKRGTVLGSKAHGEARDAIVRVVKAMFAELIMRVRPPVSVGIHHIGLARRLRRCLFVHIWSVCGRDVGEQGMRNYAKTCDNTAAAALASVCLLRRRCRH